jgi:hypothetical protein
MATEPLPQPAPQLAAGIAQKPAKLEVLATPGVATPQHAATVPGSQTTSAGQSFAKNQAAGYYGSKDLKKPTNRDYADNRGADRGDRPDRDSGRDSRDNHRDQKYESRGNKKYANKRRSSSSSSRGKRRDDKPYLDKRVDTSYSKKDFPSRNDDQYDRNDKKIKGSNSHHYDRNDNNMS